MQISDIKEYKLIEKKFIKEINSEGYLLLHKKTQAKIVLLSNDDENKVFNIGFRTPPADDTGVAHIIEHTVLCGSEKFPVKDPFIELAKGSLNTFLNAMTYPEKTVFPVASCNDTDFDNLVDVYMDAVLHPNIYKEEKIFKQEGWHYEMADENSPLIYNGVVYNEMKGAFSSPDSMLYREIMHSLFPDNCYGFESGGKPENIPELTYQQFLDFHSKYYHPSNSYIYLYGNMDMAKKLVWLDKEYLSKYDYLEVDSEIKKQLAFSKMKKVELEYPITDSEPLEDNTMIAYNIVMGNSLDEKLYLSMQMLDYALISMSGAPLKQALLDEGIGKDIGSLYDNGIAQPLFSIIVKNANANDTEKFYGIIREQLKMIVENGIDKKSLEAAINDLEFKYRESDFGRFPKGLMFGLQMMDSWIYDWEKPFLHIETDEVFKFLREKINTDYYEKLIQEHFLNNTHASLLTAVPVRGLATKNDKKLEEKLEALKNSLSDDEIQKLVKETKELHEYQQTPSTPEELKTIPLLSINDISRDAFKTSNKVFDVDGIKVYAHDYFTSKITYVTMVFDARKLPYELLPYMGLLKYLMSYMSTEKYSYSELCNEMLINTGNVSIMSQVRFLDENNETFMPTLEISFKAFDEKIDKAFELVNEILFATDFKDYTRLKEIISELKSRIQTSFLSSGDSFAGIRARSYYSEPDYIMDQLIGVDFYKFVENFEKNFHELKEDVASKLNEVLKYVLRMENIIVSYTHELDNGIGPIENGLKSVKSNLISEDIKQADNKFVPVKKNEGFLTSAQIQFVCRAGNFKNKGAQYSDSLKVLKTILDYEYLWNNIRVKGGAYGCGNSYSRRGDCSFTSYRDPNLKNTNEIFNKLPEWVSNFDADDRDMTKYIIGTISSMDTPLTPSMKGSRSFAIELANNSYETRYKTRQNILNTKVSDIRDCANILSTALEDEYLCVIGSENKIKEDAELFDTIVNLFE